MIAIILYCFITLLFGGFGIYSFKKYHWQWFSNFLAAGVVGGILGVVVVLTAYATPEADAIYYFYSFLFWLIITVFLGCGIWCFAWLIGVSGEVTKGQIADEGHFDFQLPAFVYSNLWITYISTSLLLILIILAMAGFGRNASFKIIFAKIIFVIAWVRIFFGTILPYTQIKGRYLMKLAIYVSAIIFIVIVLFIS